MANKHCYTEQIISIIPCPERILMLELWEHEGERHQEVTPAIVLAIKEVCNYFGGKQYEGHVCESKEKLKEDGHRPQEVYREIVPLWRIDGLGFEEGDAFDCDNGVTCVVYANWLPAKDKQNLKRFWAELEKQLSGKMEAKSN
jgi:hypothetical protein